MLEGTIIGRTSFDRLRWLRAQKRRAAGFKIDDDEGRLTSPWCVVGVEGTTESVGVCLKLRRRSDF